MCVVHALYHRSNKVLYAIVSLYVVEVVVMTGSLVISVKNSTTDDDCETTVPLTIVAYGCVQRYPRSKVLNLPSFRAASLFFELFLLIMTAHQVLRGSWRSIRLMRIVLRDGLWAFALIFSEPSRLRYYNVIY